LLTLPELSFDLSLLLATVVSDTVDLFWAKEVELAGNRLLAGIWGLDADELDLAVVNTSSTTDTGFLNDSFD
jgi:hypothetical protein